MNMKEIITNLMARHPVTSLQSDSKDHARHAIEQALLNNHINRGVYEELIGYVIFVRYRDEQR